MNQKRKWRKVSMRFLIFFVAYLFSLTPVYAFAQEANLAFYVTPEFPDSQVEDSSSYYDLNLEPGETETLSLRLQNANDEAKSIQITAHTAYTNVHGVVEYGKDALNPDETLPYSLDELLDTPEVIELAGNETKTVEIPIHMPQESFDGFLAGGLRISEVQEEQEVVSGEEEGVAIKNEFAYVVGVVVSNSRGSVQPDLELLDVFADQLNYRNVISATIQNFTPTFVNRMTVDATVQRVGENDVLYEASEEMMQMAPNSHFHFPIPLNGDHFRSGDYILNLTARSGEQEWNWIEEFSIEADKARSLNREDVTIDSSPNWFIIGTTVFILCLLAIIAYLIIQNKKNKQSLEKKE